MAGNEQHAIDYKTVIASARDTRLAIYAREGFTERFRRTAQEDGVVLRTLDDLYSDP